MIRDIYDRLIRVQHDGLNKRYYNVDFIKFIEIEPVKGDGKHYFQLKLYCKDSQPQYSFEIFDSIMQAENKLKEIMWPKPDLNKANCKLRCYEDE